MFSPSQISALVIAAHRPFASFPRIEELRMTACLVTHTRPFLVRAAMVVPGSLRSLQ